MKKGPLVILVLVASSAPLAVKAQEARSVDAPVASPSPTPSPSPALGQAERREAMRRQAAVPGKAVVVAQENHTQVQVVSVDATAGTMTFNDVEDETNTWRFEPAGIARDPLLKPGARVTIIWKSDEKGQPIPTILGVVAFTPPSSAAPPPRRRPSAGGGNVQPEGSPSPPPPPASPPPR